MAFLSKILAFFKELWFWVLLFVVVCTYIVFRDDAADENGGDPW